MGYDVHITRADNWTESRTRPIALDEWTSYVRSDPEMRLDNSAELEVEGNVMSYENEGLAVWVEYSGHGVDGNRAWFDYSEGRIVVKNPDEEILGKMKQIAAGLNGRVIGDEGEVY